MAELSTPGMRTAIVTVSGIGDAPRDGATDSVVTGLLKHCPDQFVRAEEAIDWYPIPGTDPQAVKRARLVSPDGDAVVDVFEMWWADLSRFPGAVRTSLATLVGMLLLAPTIGRAALLGGPPLRRRKTVAPAADGDVAVVGVPADAAPDTDGRDDAMRVSAAAIGVVEWIVAVPILVFAVLSFVIVAGAAYSVWTGATSLGTYVGLGALGLVATAGVVLWLARYRRRHWAAEWVGGVFGLGVVVLGVSCVVADGGAADRGLADTLLLMSMYGVRAAWLLAAACVLGLLVALVFNAARGRVNVWRRGRTALASLTGPFGLALVSALLDAAAGAALQKVTATQFHDRATPWCMGVQDWSPQHCDPATSATVYAWGLHLFAGFVVPLVYVTVALVVALVATLVVTEALMVVRKLHHPQTAPGPLDVTNLLERVTIGVAWAAPPAALGVVAAWVPVRVGPDASSISPGVLLGSAWPSTLAAVTGLALTGLASVAGVLRWSPLDILKNSPGNEGFTSIADHLYDIATFLREPRKVERADPGRKGGRGRLRSVTKVEEVPRFQMLDRFAALFAHIGRGDPAGATYDRVVVFAHSQGTVLATAALADRPSIPRPALITFGCPLRNLYWDAFPSQFAWVNELLVDPGRFVTPRLVRWENFGADSDFVGRTIFGPPPPDDVRKKLQPGDWIPDNTRTGAYPHGDRTIGPGGHGSYWSNAHVFQALAVLATGTESNGTSTDDSASATPPAITSTLRDQTDQPLPR